MADKKFGGVGKIVKRPEGSMGIWIDSEHKIRVQMDVIPDCKGTADMSLVSAKKLRDTLAWAIGKIEAHRRRNTVDK